MRRFGSVVDEVATPPSRLHVSSRQPAPRSRRLATASSASPPIFEHGRLSDHQIAFYNQSSHCRLALAPGIARRYFLLYRAAVFLIPKFAEFEPRWSSPWLYRLSLTKLPFGAIKRIFSVALFARRTSDLGHILHKL